MQKLDIGPRVDVHAAAVSSLTYQPSFDREASIAYILVKNASATDTWTVVVGGREIMRFYNNILGNNQLLGGQDGNYPRVRDLFTWYHHFYDEYLTIPVPRGQYITVSSLGGATADVTLFGYDLEPGTTNVNNVNHYQGKVFIMPYAVYVNASISALGETLVDTLVKPAWVGQILNKNPFTPGYRLSILNMFLEAASVNTFSGAANHVSKTEHFAIIKNGERLFSHVQSGQVSGSLSTVTTVPSANLVAPNGIDLMATAAAAGSANTVFSQRDVPFPAFQVLTDIEQPVMDPPIVIEAGMESEGYIGLTGDVTGGASYANAVMQLLVKVEQTT